MFRRCVLSYINLDLLIGSRDGKVHALIFDCKWDFLREVVCSVFFFSLGKETFTHTWEMVSLLNICGANDKAHFKRFIPTGNEIKPEQDARIEHSIEHCYFATINRKATIWIRHIGLYRIRFPSKGFIQLIYTWQSQVFIKKKKVLKWIVSFFSN